MKVLGPGPHCPGRLALLGWRDDGRWWWWRLSLLVKIEGDLGSAQHAGVAGHDRVQGSLRRAAKYHANSVIVGTCYLVTYLAVNTLL